MSLLRTVTTLKPLILHLRCYVTCLQDLELILQLRQDEHCAPARFLLARQDVSEDVVPDVEHLCPALDGELQQQGARTSMRPPSLYLVVIDTTEA